MAHPRDHPRLQARGRLGLAHPGGPDDFPRLIRMVTSFEQAKPRFSVVGALFAIRQMLGDVFGWDEQTDDPMRPSLRRRLPEDLRNSPSTVTPAMGFSPLYQLDDEWAAELINATVHGVIHLGWVPDESGRVPRADGDPREAERPAGAGLHGRDHALPLSDRVPADGEEHRPKVAVEERRSNVATSYGNRLAVK